MPERINYKNISSHGFIEMSEKVFSKDESGAIIKAARETVISSPMTSADIIRVIDLIGDVYSLGMNIEGLFKKAGLTFHEIKSKQ